MTDFFGGYVFTTANLFTFGFDLDVFPGYSAFTTVNFFFCVLVLFFGPGPVLESFESLTFGTSFLWSLDGPCLDFLGVFVAAVILRLVNVVGVSVTVRDKIVLFVVVVDFLGEIGEFFFGFDFLEDVFVGGDFFDVDFSGIFLTILGFNGTSFLGDFLGGAGFFLSTLAGVIFFGGCTFFGLGFTFGFVTFLVINTGVVKSGCVVVLTSDSEVVPTFVCESC